MKCGIFIFVFLGVTSSMAKDSCNDLRAEQIRLAIAASNLKNAHTTRTPEGGPYKPLKITKCEQGGCELEKSVPVPLLKFLPDHPDADVNGYVAFPVVNAADELTSLNLAAAKLSLLASQSACGSKMTDHGSTVLITYVDLRAGAKEDLFLYDRNRQITAWRRTDAQGKVAVMNLQPRGRILTAYEEVLNSR